MVFFSPPALKHSSTVLSTSLIFSALQLQRSQLLFWIITHTLAASRIAVPSVPRRGAVGTGRGVIWHCIQILFELPAVPFALAFVNLRLR